MCSDISATNTGLPVYLYNQGYPSKIRAADTNCSCSVETANCTSQVNVYFVHFQLADGNGSCTGTQTIKIASNETERTFTCSVNTYYTITLKMISSTNYLTVLLDNSRGSGDGYFWIGFEGMHVMQSPMCRNILNK